MERETAGTYYGRLSGHSPLRRLLIYRGALRVLTARQLKLRYRRSLLGFLWTLVYPVLATVVLTLVFARVFPAVANYALYAMIGVLVWHCFSVSCLQAADSLLASAPILRKVYVPSAIFPIAAVAANVGNFLFCMAVLPFGLWMLGAAVRFQPWAFVYGVAVLSAFTAGVALAVASLNVFFRDVRYLFEALLLVWFYATPIVYPVDVLSTSALTMLSLNPLYWVLAVMRSAIAPGPSLQAGAEGIAGVSAVVSLVAGWHVYGCAAKRFHHYL